MTEPNYKKDADRYVAAVVTQVMINVGNELISKMGEITKDPETIKQNRKLEKIRGGWIR